MKRGIKITFRRSNVVWIPVEWLQACLVQLATVRLSLRLIILILALSRYHVAQKTLFCDLVSTEAYFVLLLLLIILLHQHLLRQIVRIPLLHFSSRGRQLVVLGLLGGVLELLGA